MNPLNPYNPGLWGSWSWNESESSDGVAKNKDTGQPIYAPGEPPEQKPDKEIKDWPSVDFGD